jgi:hypothetical protein
VADPARGSLLALAQGLVEVGDVLVGQASQRPAGLDEQPCTDQPRGAL